MIVLPSFLSILGDVAKTLKIFSEHTNARITFDFPSLLGVVSEVLRTFVSDGLLFLR